MGAPRCGNAARRLHPRGGRKARGWQLYADLSRCGRVTRASVGHRSAIFSAPRLRKSVSHETPRWGEMDSNFRSPVRRTAFSRLPVRITRPSCYADERSRPIFLFGTESEPPPNSQQKFLANWWFTGDDGDRMKQSTSFPVISFGTAAVTYKSKNSPLGDLIGGNSGSDFTFLSVRGVYPAATMTVTFKSSGDK